MRVGEAVPAAGEREEDENGQRPHETEHRPEPPLACGECERREADETRADGSLREHREREAYRERQPRATPVV